MSRSLRFSRLLAAKLRGGRIEPAGPKYYKVIGRFDVGAIYVSLEVRVHWLFKDHKRNPPAVWCHEKWMKEGAEWHNGPPMCWVLPEEWRDAMAWKGKPVQSILNEGAAWLLVGVKNLINRHYTAHEEGLSVWPKEWAFWAHYEEGVREYEREKAIRTR